MNEFNMQIKPIGYIRSCYPDRFAIPRQSGLSPSAPALLCLSEVDEEALVGLGEFSHLWVIYLFHQLKGDKEKARVRLPRLGGDKTLGVFATRSPFRTNPLGLSSVLIEKISGKNIWVRGGDFLDHTPIIDLKPYLAYCDSHPDAKGFLRPELVPVRWQAGEVDPKVMAVISESLAQDPRPAGQKRSRPEKAYMSRICGIDVQWVFSGEGITVRDAKVYDTEIAALLFP